MTTTTTKNPGTEVNVFHPAFDFELEILSRIPPWPGWAFVRELADDLGLSGPEVTAAVRALRVKGFAIQRGNQTDESDLTGAAIRHGLERRGVRFKPATTTVLTGAERGRAVWLMCRTGTATLSARAYVRRVT